MFFAPNDGANHSRKREPQDQSPEDLPHHGRADEQNSPQLCRQGRHLAAKRAHDLGVLFRGDLATRQSPLGDRDRFVMTDCCGMAARPAWGVPT